MKPINGDPGKVAATAELLLESAGSMRAAAARLSGLIAGEFTSEATDALAVNADEITAVMQNAATRYQGAGEALAVYAPVLAQCQEDVRRAIALAGTVDVGAARRAAVVAEASDLATRHDPFANDTDKAQASAAAHRAAAELDQHVAVANSAQALYEAAMATLDQAAASAISGIRIAAEMSRLNDSFWDDVDHFVHHQVSDFLEVLHDALDKVATGCAILAVLLAPLPVIGGPLFIILNAANMVLSVADLCVQMVRYMIGDVTPISLLWAMAWAMLSVMSPSPTMQGLKGFKKVAPKLAKEGVKVAAEFGRDQAFDWIVEFDVELGAGERNFLFATREFDISTHDVHTLAGTGENVDAAQIVKSNFAGRVPATLHCAGSRSGVPGLAGAVFDGSPTVGLQA